MRKRSSWARNQSRQTRIDCLVPVYEDVVSCTTITQRQKDSQKLRFQIINDFLLLVSSKDVRMNLVSTLGTSPISPIF